MIGNIRGTNKVAMVAQGRQRTCPLVKIEGEYIRQRQSGSTAQK